MKTKVLGKDTSKLKLKGIKLLEKIKRNKSDIKHGTDIWNVYDFLYLNNDLPSLKVLEIKIPSTSLFTIESKSMKLYLNGFYNQSFKSDKTVIQQIKKDLEGLLNAKIKLGIIKKFNQEPSSINLNNYKNDKTKINRILKFNGFKNIYAGTPVVIGNNGVEKVEEIELDDKERNQFNHSVEAVKKLWDAATNIDPDLK